MVITLLGVVWHYLYDWSGQSRILGAFVPVNESVWEHLKLGYWPLVLFSVVEYPFLKSKASNYYWAKLAGVLTLEGAVLLIHYSYTSLAGGLSLWVDISSFVLGVALCQFVWYKIYRMPTFKKSREVPALLGFIALGLLFMLTTYSPPRYGIFRDKNDNTIGIDTVY